MAGVLPGKCFNTGKLTRFGYVNLIAEEDNLLCRAGESIPAHEFHHWDCTEPGGRFTARKPSGRSWRCAAAGKRLYAGFPHFHFLANPTFGVISAEPHFHRDEEYLAFVGHDLRNAFDSFDAEITFWMGERLDDMEKIVIDKPTMIKVPGLWWHGPLEITRLGKPLFFQPVLYNSRYYAIYRRVDKSGRPYMETVFGSPAGKEG